MINSPQHTQMGSKTGQKVTKEWLDKMVLSAYSNMVLVRVPNYKGERTTKAGIIIDVNPDVQYLDGDGSHMADMERITGIVEKVPTGLLTDDDILPWKTTMELQVGDFLWYDYMDSLHSTSFIVDDDEYKLIPYASCYVADRELEPWGDDAMWVQTICLNGYCLFEEVYEKDDGFSKPKVDMSLGLVHSVGFPVEYANYWTDNIEIKPGDRVKFRKKASRVFIERAKHLQKLEKSLFRHQRRDIEYVF